MPYQLVNDAPENRDSRNETETTNQVDADEVCEVVNAWVVREHVGIDAVVAGRSDEQYSVITRGWHPRGPSR